jgi:hypothetical protein
MPSSGLWPGTTFDLGGSTGLGAYNQGYQNKMNQVPGSFLGGWPQQGTGLPTQFSNWGANRQRNFLGGGAMGSARWGYNPSQAGTGTMPSMPPNLGMGNTAGPGGMSWNSGAGVPNKVPAGVNPDVLNQPFNPVYMDSAGAGKGFAPQGPQTPFLQLLQSMGYRF